MCGIIFYSLIIGIVLRTLLLFTFVCFSSVAIGRQYFNKYYNTKGFIFTNHPLGGDCVGSGKLLNIAFKNIASTGSTPLKMSSVNVLDVNFSAFSTKLDDGSITMMTTGISDTKDFVDVKIFPNPFTDYTKLEVDLVKSDHLSIETMDACGNPISKIGTENFSIHHVVQIQNLDYTGILLVKVKTNRSSKVF